MNPPDAHQAVRERLSAYLDQELTQAEEQRVRLHLEGCPECRRALEQLAQLQKLTAQMRFPDPPEETMQELERRLSVRAPRSAGWLLVLGGLLAWLVYGGVMALLHWRTPTLQEMAGGAVAIGVLLLFISVLRERLLELPHDRYRRIEK